MIEVYGKKKRKPDMEHIELGDKQAPITVSKTDTHINISILLDHIRKTPNFDIVQAVSLAISPIFTNENKQPIQKQMNVGKTAFPHIGFFIEDRGHYTGGRYSTWMTAVILSQITRVTVITNSEPAFYNDIFPYFNDNFKYVVDSNYGFDKNKYDFDIIVGVPQLSGQYAAEYASQHNLPFYAWMFESPNWIREYRDGVDASDDYWESYKKCLEQAYYIIVPSHESRTWLQKWLIGLKPIKVLYPCLNELVIKKTRKLCGGDKRVDKQRTRVIFSSRMADFKNPLPIIKQLPKTWIYNIIGKCWKKHLDQIEKFREEGYKIDVYQAVEDKKKFSYIAAADVLIHPSKFEGFGMSPMEALHLRTPVVCYDLPVLREIYGNTINYAKLGDRKDFIQVVHEVVKKQPKIVKLPKKQLAFRHIYNHLSRAKEIFEIPEISFGVLAYNCADYLQSSISSIYHLAHEIIIVEGAVKGYASDPRSNDGTNEILKKMIEMDHWKKIKVLQIDQFWSNKMEMQNVIAKNVTGEFYIKMDADEVWKPETVMGVIDLFYNNPNLTTVRMPFLHFWTAFDKVAKDAGGKWGTKHHRVWRWKPGMKHRKSFNHFIDPSNDNRPVVAPHYDEYEWTGDPIYHFGYARKLDIITQKLKYYKSRGIEIFVKNTYEAWKKMTDLTQPTQQVRSWAEEFDVNQLPEVMKNHTYYKTKDIRKLK